MNVKKYALCVQPAFWNSETRMVHNWVATVLFIAPLAVTKWLGLW